MRPRILRLEDVPATGSPLMRFYGSPQRYRLEERDAEECTGYSRFVSWVAGLVSQRDPVAESYAFVVPNTRQPRNVRTATKSDEHGGTNSS